MRCPLTDLEESDLFSSSDHTFVVCAYRKSPFLRECVSSLMAQTVHTRVIVATSTPNELIRDVASEFGLALAVNQGEPGIAHDWNCALRHADTPLVTIAHQDDVYNERYAEVALAYCGRAEKPLLFFTDYGELREGRAVDQSHLLRVKRAMLRPLKSDLNWGNIRLRRRMMSFGSPICCPSVTYCLTNLTTPVFLEGMRGGLDWDAWERASRLSGDFVYAPEVLMHHRIHEESETSALIRDDIRSREDYEMFRRFWPAPVAMVLNGLYGLSRRSNAL